MKIKQSKMAKSACSCHENNDSNRISSKETKAKMSAAMKENVKRNESEGIGEMKSNETERRGDDQ
jgi:hypothetical protein